MMRGLASVCLSPWPGPGVSVRTTLLLAGSLSPGSSGARRRLEEEALARAKEGSGETTMVWSTRRLVSTTVDCPHFEQRNFTLGCLLTSASLRECCAPQWVQAASISSRYHGERRWAGGALQAMPHRLLKTRLKERSFRVAWGGRCFLRGSVVSSRAI